MDEARINLHQLPLPVMILNSQRKREKDDFLADREPFALNDLVRRTHHLCNPSRNRNRDNPSPVSGNTLHTSNHRSRRNLLVHRESVVRGNCVSRCCDITVAGEKVTWHEGP